MHKILYHGKVTSVDVSVLEDGAIATPKIASGLNHTVALKADGSVWTYGYNNVGQLGLGDTKTRYVPTKVNIDNVIDIACGGNFSVALKQDGTVWTWGINDKGQLGQGNTKNSNIPVQVLGVGGSGTLQKVKKIGAGASQWTALLESGEVVSCGRNEAGDLCDGTTTNRTTPVYVLNHTGVGHVNNVRDISSSSCAILLLKEDGTVWAGGHNCQGQSGQGNTTANHLIKQVKNSAGTGTLGNIIDFSVSSHILALDADGSVWAWGYNNYGQIGNNSTTNALLPVKVKDPTGSGELSNIVKIEAGYYYSMAIADDGTVYAWGYNKNGQLGNNTTATSKLPKKVLAEDGLTNFTDVMLVSEFGEHTNIAKTDGTVWTVGYNANGELGDDTNVSRKLVKSISNATLDVNEKYLQFTKTGETKKIEVKLDQGFNLLIGSTSATGNKFTSYNENIATVDEQGNVLSIGAGETYIKIENENLGLVTTVKVVVPDRDGITVPKVVGGANHYVALKADGSVWTWGLNGNGQLGIGNTTNQLEPVFTGMENVIDVAAGANFTAILKKDKTVWVTGQNNYGQLGQGNTTGSNVFIQVKAENGLDSLTDIIAITASDYYMAALKSDGTVYTWGYNGYGQLGDNTTTASKLPTKVRKVNNIMQIAAGANHLVMLDSDSTVWAVGRNNNGQLGIKSTKDSKLPVKMLNSKGTEEINNIRQIAAGGSTTYLLDADGIVWGVGYNGYGQLTDGTTTQKTIPVQAKDAAGNVITDVVYVAARSSTVGIVKKDGSVYTAGYNEYGAAGNGSKATNKAFTRVLGEYGSGLFENGLLIALTNNSSLVADKLGRVYTTGYNAYGQMGDGTINSSTNLVGISNVSLEVEEPIIVMNNINETKDIKAHMNLGFNLLYKTLEDEHYTYESFNKNIASVDEAGTVKALKYGNARIEVTNAETSNTATVIVKVVREGDIANPKVVSGTDFTIALKADGTVYSWGYNQYGQLGLGDNLNRTEPVKINIDKVVDITCGNSHVLYLKEDGSVWATGLNNQGQLGDNTTINRNTPVQVLGVDNIIKIAAGANHSLVLRSDGTVYSFGYNNKGQLGDTTTTRKSQAVQVKRLQDIKEIAAGNHSSLALDINGYVWVFGQNASGQLGIGTKANVLIPTRIQTINEVQEIAYGTDFGVIVKSDGTVYSFGVNGNGQLGIGNTTAKNTPTQVIKADGGALTNIEKVSAGNKYVLAKTYDGKMYGWGIGNTYQFGNEATANVLRATQLKYNAKGDIIENVLEVSAGDTHSVMVKEDGTVWTTGKNNYGQLGDKTTINKAEWICISDIRIKLPETSITIPKINGTYSLKPELQVGFNLLFDNMSNASYKYISKNEQVATVSDTGVITGLKQGKTKIGITESNTNKTVYVDVYVLAEGDIAFPQVITREYTTVALKSDGTVWTWGYNVNGELGIDSNTNQIAPCKVDIENVQRIAVGNNHVLALKEDGTVWAWGSNSNGQLGSGDKVNSKVPVKVKNLKDIKEIAAGNGMSMAVDKDGKLFTWGLNDCGQLGINSKQEKLEPFLVEAISNISKIAVGNKSAYALTQEGVLYSFGNNNQGQLGDGTNTTRLLPVEVQNVVGVIDIAASSTEQAYALMNDGTVYGWGYSSLGALTDVGGAVPKALAGPDGKTRLGDIASIDAGYYGAVAITDDGEVLAWGVNGYGGLGNGSTAKSVAVPTYVKENATDNLSSVFIASMGRNYSMFAKEDGSVWGTGYNEYGQLGNTSKVTVYTAENISNDYISTNCTEVIIKGIGNNTAINAKYINGFNLYNRENSNPITFETQDNSIVAVDENGNIASTGLGKTYITLTAGGLGRRVEVNVLQDTEVAVMDLQAGNRHTIGLKTDGTIWSFGANSNGQLGIDSIDNKTQTEPIQVTAVPEGIKFTKIAVGKDHSLALGDNGKVYAWGANAKGQLGNGQTVDSGKLVEVRNLSNIEKIVAFENMSYAIDKNGVAYVWGEGFTWEPQKISFFAKIIDISGRYLLSEYGTVWNVNNLEEKIAGLNNIVEIAAGDSHLLALDTSSNVYGLGNNTYGQLGVSGVKNVTVPTLIKDVSGNNITDIESIKASQYSSYMLTKQGDVYSFGRNSNNALGIESKVASTSLPTKLDISKVERISAGQNYAVAVLEDGFTYSWGINTYGQLGLGNKEETAKPTLIGRIKAVKGKDVVTIKEGESVSVPVSINNTFNLRYDVVANDGFTYKSIDESIASTNNDVITGVKSGLTTVVVEHPQTQLAANISVEVLKDNYNSVIDVKSGIDFTITLKADGTVWGWGANGAGQLANNTTVDVNQPIQIVTKDRVKQIAAGGNYIALLTEDGKVYTAGENTDGQLGCGSNVNQKTLVAVIDELGKPLENIVRVAIKNNTTYAQDIDGNVYVFGKNYYNVATKIKDLAQVAGIYGEYAITKDNKVINITTKLEIAGLENVVKIAEGTNHTLFLTKNKTVYAIGQNNNGQCGTGTKTNCVVPTLVKNNIGTSALQNVRDISAGDNYSIAVLENGEVYTWGANNSNVLGTEQASAQILPRKNLNINEGMIVSAAYNHTVVAKTNGRVYAWGDNSKGSLGTGENTNSVIPVRVGSEEIKVNTNHLQIEKGNIDVLSGVIKSFNLINEENSDGIVYESKDESIVTVDKNSGVVRAVGVGNTSILVKQASSDKFAIVQVTVLKAGTTIKPDVRTSNSHSVILKADGTVWTYGDNTYGELGNGTTISQDDITQVNFANNVKITQIAVGENHTLALDETGVVWAFGRNNYYQLGTDRVDMSSTPIKVKIDKRVVKIAAGYNQSFAITEDNRLYVWGLNSNGELGVGTYETQVLPSLIENVNEVLDVASGKTHTVIVTTKGNVYTTGNNSYSSLTGTEYKRNVFRKAEGLENIVYIEAGEYHSAAINTNNELYVWGLNIYGQLGIGNLNTIATPEKVTGITGIQEMSLGKSHTQVSTKAGEVYVSGINTLGQLGDGTNDDTQSFKKLDTISDVYEVASGNTYSMAITNDGKVFGWGDYYHGTSAIRTKTNSNIPVQVGVNEFLISTNEITIPNKGTSKIEVQNSSELNVWNATTVNTAYVYSSVNDDIASVDAQGIVTAKAKGITWIKVTEVATGKEQIAVVRVTEEGSTAYPEISSGKDFAISLKADGSLWSFGYNSNGELGNNSFVGTNVPKSINIIKSYAKIKSGDQFTLVLRNDGTVWSFGDNTYGQLGTGDRNISKTPTMVKGLSDISKIAAGSKHSVALDKYGDVFVWGQNDKGQLGTKDTKTLDVPTKLSLNGKTIIDVAAGKNNTVLVTSSGEIVVYGKDKDSIDISKVKDVAKVAVGNEIIVITKSGLVQKVGSNLETIYANGDAVEVSANGGNYMILTKTGKVYTFGENENGELGLGSNSNVTVPTLVDFEQKIVGMGMGVNNSYIITENGNVYGAGINKYSNLGNENTEDSNVFVLVGKQDFKVIPDNIQMNENDKLDVEIESERYNVFKQDLRKVEDFTWVSGDESVAELESEGKLKALAEGETTLTITEKETGFEKEITVVVMELDANRLEKLSVDGIDAKVTGSRKYEVTISSDSETGSLLIQTKDATDVISIDSGNTWTTTATLIDTINLLTRETVIPIKVKTTNGTIFDYELKVIKQSKIVDLKEVKVNNVKATAVSATEYVAIIEDETINVANVLVETKSDYAKVGLDNDAQTVKTASKLFDMTDTLVETVPIKVTSESGIDIDYTLTIYKRSAIMDLEIVTANGVQAKQNKFNILEYSVIVPTGTTQVEVYAKALYELAKLSIDNNGGNDRDYTQIIKIEDDETIVNIKVSVDGIDRVYKLHIYRKIDGASLARVEVNGKEIIPVGNKYQAYVAADQTDAEVRAVAAVETSSVQIGTNPASVKESTVTVDTVDNSTVYTILVTDAEDSTNVATYQLVITKPSGNTALKSIIVGNNEMTKEATRIPGTNTYTVSVNEKYTNLTITATADYELSQVAIAENPYRDAFDRYNAVCSDQTYTTTVKVKAQDGTEVEYTLIIEKTSSNTNIKSINVDGIEATKSTTETDTYEVTLTRPLTEAQTTVVMEHAKAKVALNNILYETNTISKTIDIDAKDVKVTINTQAEDGTLKTYYLIIHELPDNTKVTKIEVDGYTATKAPYSNTYKVRVPKTLTIYNVKVTPDDNLAMVKIGANTASQGISNANVAKTEPKTVVNITVTAQNGKAEEEYVLEIEDMNSNAELSFVKINGTPIGKNDAGEYYTKVIGSTTSVVVDVETADKLAKVGILTTPTSNTLEETLNLTTNKNTFTITVEAEDGTIKTYPLVVEKMSSNTNLGQIFVDGVQIPLVDGEYRANIGNATEATIRAVADNATSLVGIDGETEELAESTRTVSVTDKQKRVAVIVTAEDGTSNTHYVVLEKYSDDNTLLKLSKENDATQVIIQTGENSYQMVVSNELTSFNLVAETSSKVAEVKIGDNGFETNITTKPVAISEDTTEVTITVKAQNGEEKSYTLTIIKKCELTIQSITVNGNNAEVKDNEWIAWIDKDKDLSTVVVTPTSSQAKVFVEDVIDVVGPATFNTDTTNDETIVKIKLYSTTDNDEVIHTLRIMKKSDNTELEYVKVAGQIGIFDEDSGKYIVKVPIQTGLYDMEVKTVSQYAEVKIENQEYKPQIDTMNIDLTGKNEENLTVSVRAQDGTPNTYPVVIQKVSDDNTIKLLTVNGEEITQKDGTYKAFIKANLANVPVYIETTSETAKIRIDQEETEVEHIVNNRIVTMNSDEETLSITVTAEDGSVKYYTLSIQKESNDVGLEWIKVDGISAIEKQEDEGEAYYYVTAKAGATKVDITASTANQYAFVSINGNEATMKQNELKEYELDPDTKIISIPVVVTAQNDKDTKTYTLKIEQVSNDTDIAEIKVNGDPVVTYNAETKMYEFIIDSSIDEATIYVKAKNSEATVKIDTFDPEKSASTQTVSTASDENIYTITIIAEDGTTETREINIKKLSQDASIVKLFVEGEEITPEDDANGVARLYTAEVLDSLTKATVRIKAGNKNATIEVNGTALPNLGEDETDIVISGHGEIVVPIKIIAEDTNITQDYTLTINVVSDNKDLEYLKVGGVEVTDYDPKTFTYKMFIPADSTEAKIDAKTVSPYATTAIEETTGNDTISYTAEINNDITEVSLTVTAEDTTPRTYTIVLQKKSTDTDLLEVKADNELINANEEDGIYVVEVTEDKETVKLFAKATNEYALVSIAGETATKETQEKEITLDAGKETTVTITVTPQEGESKDYTVKIRKLSSNNSIDYIKVNTENVTEYDADTKTYEKFIPSNSVSANIEVKAVSEYATITSGEDEDTGTLSFTVQTDAEDTEVEITVTAEDGKSEQYTLILHKISKDNAPKEIYVDGKLITADDDGNYIAEVLETNTTSIVKVIANNKYATVKINSSTNDDDEDEQTATLGTEKTTQVPVTITSQDGDINTFNVTIQKVSDDVGINTIYINGIESTTYDSDTKTYTAYIDEADNLTEVKVVANNSNATVILEEDVSDVGTATKNITTNTTTTNVTIVVKSESGKTENYTLEIIKKSADASILKVEVNDIEVADPYEVSIKKLDTKAKIYIETTNKNASIKFGDEPAKQWKYTTEVEIPLDKDIMTIPFTVTSQDEKQTESHTITLRRKSNNTDISKITVNGEEVDLSKDFEAIIKNVNTSEIVITLADSNAKVCIDDGNEAQGELTESLNTTTTTVRTIKVTAVDGTTKEYQITLIKKFTIIGKVITENIGSKHLATVTAYLTGDATKEVINTVQTNEDGTYEIVVEPGLYDVVITKPGYLTYRITDIPVTDGAIKYTGNAYLSAGDVYGNDGYIDIRDLTKVNKLARKKTAVNGENDANKIYDLNEDGVIDSLDIDIMYKNYNKKATSTKYIRMIEIKGNVLDAEGNALPNTKITLREKNTTDTSGNFEYENVPVGAYDLILTSEDGTPLGTSKVTIVEGEQYSVNNNIITIAPDTILANITIRVNETGANISEYGENPILALQQAIPVKTKAKTKRKETEEYSEDLVLPVNEEYTISSEFGTRTHPVTGEVDKMHYGIDIAISAGSNVLSIAEGTVTYAGENGGYGYCIEIEHTINGEKVYSFYAHLSEINVEVGETVGEGQIIALSGGIPGTPGAGTSTGAHLHLEIRKESGSYLSAVNPRDYFEF